MKRFFDKKLFVIGLLLGICVTAYAIVPEIIRQDTLKMGKGASGLDKTIEFDTLDGASNKKLVIDGSSKNGSLNVEDFTIGDGTTGNKQIIFDEGSGSGNARFRWNDSTQKIEISNDGVGFSAISDLTANSPSQIENATVATSVTSSALTIDLKIANGSSNPSAGSPVTVAFRDLIAVDGAYNLVSTTGALTIVVPSGATLGHTDGVDAFIYVYLLDESGSAEFAVSSEIKDESSVQTTTAITAGSDDDDIFSTVGRVNVPIRLIARLKSNQSTAGTWDVDVIENTPGAQFFTELQDRVRSSASNITIESVEINQPAAVCGILTELGDWIASISTFGAGFCDITPKAGIWADITKVHCNVTCAAPAFGIVARPGTNIRAGCLDDTGASSNSARNVVCKGVKF